MKHLLTIVGLSIIMVFVFLGGTGLFPSLEDNDITKGRIHIHKPIHLPSHIPVLKRQTLIFFGYVGCTDICTPRLHEIAELLKHYEQTSRRNDLEVLFINLDFTSTTEQADAFAKSFHPKFIGISIPKNEAMKITMVFDAYFSASLREKEKINHTQYLYLLRKDANQKDYLRNIYIKVPYDANTIMNDLMEKEQ